jgi:2-amino-4-hydroxy-6-hydroxymethyldihydropteridine diphosphokinase
MVMLERALAIEDAYSRVRLVPGGPRTVDVDLIAVGDRVLNGETLTLPHPRAHERAFVLTPWLEVEPDAELVGHGRVADLLAGLDASGVRRRDDLRVE